MTDPTPRPDAVPDVLAAIERVRVSLAGGYVLRFIDPGDVAALLAAHDALTADLARLRAPADLAAIEARAPTTDAERRAHFADGCAVVVTESGGGLPEVVVDVHRADDLRDAQASSGHIYEWVWLDGNGRALPDVAHIAAERERHAAELASHGDALGRSRESIAEACDAAVAEERARCAAVCRAVARGWPGDDVAAARMARSEAREFIDDGRSALDASRAYDAAAEGAPDV